MWLWHLQLRKTSTWYMEYDCTQALVIRARSANAARKLAANNSFGNETVNCHGDNPWLSTKESSCSVLRILGEAQIIIKDFKNG